MQAESRSAHNSVEASEVFWDRFQCSSSTHPANLYRYDLISRLIAGLPDQPQTVIDLGCGNGALLSHLHGKGIGATLVGCDGSTSIIARNRACIRYASFHVVDLQDPTQMPPLPIADIVVCSEVVEHMPQYLPVFATARRLLRPGGMFILTTQGGKRRRHDIQLLGHLRHYELDTLADEITGAGFVIVAKQRAGWPALTLQKIAASMFLGSVSRELASPTEPSRLFRYACVAVGLGLKVSSTRFGPQLLIMAKRAN